MNASSHSHRAHRGFTIIEVMIALLILAIGVLGIGAMQMQTYQHLRTSQNYSQAAALAGEMADRIYANSAQAESYVTDGSISSLVPCSNDCSSAQLASNDILEWLVKIGGKDTGGNTMPGALPSGTGQVTRVGLDDSYVITVRWDDDLSGSSGTNCPVQSDSDLDCYQLTVSL